MPDIETTMETAKAADGVAALDRAIAILTAFTPADRALTLAELARRTGLYKSTILRLAGSLLHSRFLERLEDGRYRLGSALFQLGTTYQRMLGSTEVILPVMRTLAAASGESVAFYVRSGNMRTCLCRIESDHPLRYSIREGDALPLGQGSGGRVLEAFSGAAGEPYEQIRHDGYFTSLGDRDPEIVGISAPVFGPGNVLVGALTVAGPRTRIDVATIDRLRPELLTAADTATKAFGGDTRLSL